MINKKDIERIKKENDFDNILSNVNLIDVLSKAEGEFVTINGKIIPTVAILDYIYNKAQEDHGMFVLLVHLLDKSHWINEDEKDLNEEQFFFAKVFNNSENFRKKLKELDTRFNSIPEIRRLAPNFVELGDLYTVKFKDNIDFYIALIDAIGQDRIVDALYNDVDYIKFCGVNISIEYVVNLLLTSNHSRYTKYTYRYLDCLLNLYDAGKLTNETFKKSLNGYCETFKNNLGSSCFFPIICSTWPSDQKLNASNPKIMDMLFANANFVDIFSEANKKCCDDASYVCFNMYIPVDYKSMFEYMWENDREQLDEVINGDFEKLINHSNSFNECVREYKIKTIEEICDQLNKKIVLK